MARLVATPSLSNLPPTWLGREIAERIAPRQVHRHGAAPDQVLACAPAYDGLPAFQRAALRGRSSGARRREPCSRRPPPGIRRRPFAFATCASLGGFTWWTTRKRSSEIWARSRCPQSLTPLALAIALQHRRGRIKPILLNQRILAGLGNIYVDESLWCARIHPMREAQTLSRPRYRASP